VQTGIGPVRLSVEGDEKPWSFPGDDAVAKHKEQFAHLKNTLFFRRPLMIDRE
jgi:hypothetical protein